MTNTAPTTAPALHLPDGIGAVIIERFSVYGDGEITFLPLRFLHDYAGKPASHIIVIDCDEDLVYYAGQTLAVTTAKRHPDECRNPALPGSSNRQRVLADFFTRYPSEIASSALHAAAFMTLRHVMTLTDDYLLWKDAVDDLVGSGMTAFEIVDGYDDPFPMLEKARFLHAMRCRTT